MSEEIKFNMPELVLMLQGLDMLCEQMTGQIIQPYELSSHAMSLVSLAEARKKVQELKKRTRN